MPRHPTPEVPATLAVVGSYGVGLTFDLARVPAGGETVMARSFRTDLGGKGSNQAVGAARLGARVALLTTVGDDAFGTEARALWAREGVDASAVRTVAAKATMCAAILVETSGENRIVVVPGALDDMTADDVARFESTIASATLCLVGTEIPVPVAHAALEMARAHGVTTVLNPAPAPEGPGAVDLLALADFVTPNASEAATLAGDHGTPEELAERLLALGAGTVVITLGAAGALLAAPTGQERIPADVVTPIDTTGAGDAFNAAFAVAIAEGRGAADACRWGCRAGSHAVQARGVVPGLPSRAQILSALPHDRPRSSGASR